MLLYLVRHGDVEENGGPDPPLSAEGRTSAAADARLLIADGAEIDILLCSPLRRAVEHATILGGLTGNAITVLESLEPEGDIGDLIQLLQSERWDGIVVVGHLPQLRRTVSRLASPARPAGIRFENGGMASINTTVIEGELKGKLRWLVGKRILDGFSVR